MGDFEYFLIEGFQHILDIKGYDHILFIVMLCSFYKIEQWKRIFVLVTAFTLGHSITLGLAVFNLVKLPSSLVELLIAITIMVTCVLNLFLSHKPSDKKISYNYLLALFFGLIHGLGFSNYLRSILMGIDNLTIPLISFNLGIEFGQLQVVLQFIGLIYILMKLGMTHKRLKYIINILGIFIVLPMIIERI